MSVNILYLPYCDIQRAALNFLATLNAKIIYLLVVIPKVGVSKRIENSFRQVIEVSFSFVWGICCDDYFDAGSDFDI
ncbi:endodeoxyribonuclease [Providencia rustigianii]